VNGRIDNFPQLSLFDESNFFTVLRGHFHFFVKLVNLIGFSGDIQFAGANEIAVNVIALDGLFDTIEIGLPQLSKLGKFLWPARQSVVEVMRQGCRNEPPFLPLAPFPASPHSSRTTSRDGSDFLRKQGAPKSREACSDDRQVCRSLVSQRIGRVRPFGSSIQKGIGFTFASDLSVSGLG